MQLGIIGLGRMGANIGRRVMRAGHTVIGFDANAAAIKALEGAPEGKAQGAASLEDLVKKLQPPCTVWSDAAAWARLPKMPSPHWVR